MTAWLRWPSALIGAALGGGALALLVGGNAWNRQSARMVEELKVGAVDAGPATFFREELRGLPAPVVRYFEFALTPGQSLIRSARLEHRGDFRGSIDARWSPFQSVQHFVVQQPGFVWDARVRMAPLTTVRVRDSYIGGRAGMLARLAGMISVVDEKETPHLNSGALHRYLLETPWVPTALLPSQGVSWEEIDDRSARASLTDSGMTVSMVAHFAETGEIVRVEAVRMRDVNGSGVLTPFVGHLHEHARIDGMLIPIAGEVEWILPEGTLQFWRGRITDAAYEYAERGATTSR
jgi:hypothetical protein